MSNFVAKAVCLALISSSIMCACGTGKIVSDTSTQNATIQTIMKRKSVRSYTTQKVSYEQIQALLKAAMAAPSGRNIQPWRFVVVSDKETLAKLAESLPYAKMLTQASVAIVVCGDTTYVKHSIGETVPNNLWVHDCAAATENLLLAAESMGLGAVWTATYPYPERYGAVKAALGIPDSIMPLCVVPVGYPAGNEKPKDKWKPENIHYNKW